MRVMRATSRKWAVQHQEPIAERVLERAAPRARLRLPGLTLLITLPVLAVGITSLPRLYRLAARQPQTVDQLLSAAGIGDVDGVRSALDDGVQPDANTNGITALAVTSDPAIARLLLSRGAKLDGISDRGTPLLQAVATERLAVARVLLEAGADPNLRMPASSLSPIEAARQRPNAPTT